MAKKEINPSVNIHRLLAKLGDVCDAEDVTISEELSAVSMLLSVIAYRADLNKKQVLVKMGNSLDHMYTALKQKEKDKE